MVEIYNEARLNCKLNSSRFKQGKAEMEARWDEAGRMLKPAAQAPASCCNGEISGSLKIEPKVNYHDPIPARGGDLTEVGRIDIPIRRWGIVPDRMVEHIQRGRAQLEVLTFRNSDPLDQIHIEAE
jgi:hypothetical protein